MVISFVKNYLFLKLKAFESRFLIVLFLFSIFQYNFSVKTKTSKPNQKLSEYHFFKGNIADQIPDNEVFPYHLATPLFSDYAEKLRFISLPQNTKITYSPKDVFGFPVGTTIIKTFYFPNDFRKPESGRKLMETRLLVHETEGWKAYEYIWNREQTDAFLEITGGKQAIEYVDLKGKTQKRDYLMPNQNQCKSCHNRDEKTVPIGPTARQLNSDLDYGQGLENQLVHLQKLNYLDSLPSLSTIEKAAIWNNSNTGSLNDRARIWLDINCAHCHNDHGPAKTSGLNLSIHETDLSKLGINKTPVAAGRGSGNKIYDIFPGKPDKSILLYRLQNTDPGIMMPETGRTIVHHESVELIKEWIKGL